MAENWLGIAAEVATALGDVGQAIRMGQMFVSPSGAQFEFPGDVMHGAPASEVIQCRCYAEYRVRRDSLRYDD